MLIVLLLLLVLMMPMQVCLPGRQLSHYCHWKGEPSLFIAHIFLLLFIFQKKSDHFFILGPKVQDEGNNRNLAEEQEYVLRKQSVFQNYLSAIYLQPGLR